MRIHDEFMVCIFHDEIFLLRNPRIGRLGFIKGNDDGIPTIYVNIANNDNLVFLNILRFNGI